MAILSTNKKVKGKNTGLSVSGDTLVEHYIVITDDIETTHAEVTELNPDLPKKLSKHPEAEFNDLYVSRVKARLIGGSRTHWDVTVTYSRAISAVSPVQISTGTWILKKAVPRGVVYKLDQPSMTGEGAQDIFETHFAQLIDSGDNYEDIANSAGDLYNNPVIEEFPQPLLKYSYIIPASDDQDFGVLEAFAQLKDEYEGRLNYNYFTLMGQKYRPFQVKASRINYKVLYQDPNEDSKDIDPANVFLAVEFDFEINKYSTEYLTYLEAFYSENSAEEAGWGTLELGHIRAIADVGFRQIKDKDGNDLDEADRIKALDGNAVKRPAWLNGEGGKLTKAGVDQRSFPYWFWLTIEAVDFDYFRVFGLPELIGIGDDKYQERTSP